MATDYRDFVVYNLHDSGEISEIEVNPDDVQKILDPKEVFMLVRQDLRRIFIWKGSIAPVRKRFISARRATLLQEDIRKSGGRALKIVSVDQGDEPSEFLDCFHLESMAVTEVLEDLRYVRNAERDAEAENPNVAAAPPEGSTAHGTAEEFLPVKKPKKAEAAPESEIGEPATADAEPEIPEPTKGTETPKPPEPAPGSGAPILFNEEEITPVPAKEPAPKPKKEPKKVAPKEEPKLEPKRVPVKPKPVVRKVKPEPTPITPVKPVIKTPTGAPAGPISKEEEETMLKEVLAKPAPEGTKRINIIIGNKLIGSIVQQKSILGKSVESTLWDAFTELPTGCAEVKGIVRIYTDEARGIVAATDLIQSNPDDKIEVREELKVSSEIPEDILAEVSKVPLPSGFKRMNVVLGALLYGPVIQKKSILGKSVEKLNWELISDLPGGCTELEGLMRIFVDAEKGIVKAVDILERTASATEKTDEKADETTAPKHRKLPEIPKGDSEV